MYKKNEFYHHGILGQKWGIRNGPPYPLNPSDHSSTEKKASNGSLSSSKYSSARIKRVRYGSTASGSSSLSKKDAKWVSKQSNKITAKAEKQVSKEMKKYEKQLLKDPNAYNKSGKLSATTINKYNQKMAQLMTEKVSNVTTPSGKSVVFVAKRSELGVMMAVADQGYNMDQIKNGVWGNGRVAYKSDVLDKVDSKR